MTHKFNARRAQQSNYTAVSSKGEPIGKKFIIKSSNKEEVEQLRHSELMQSMDELNKKWGTKIRISFVANKIYLLLPTPSKYFKANLLKTVYDNDLARQLYAELTACFAIIQLLNQHH